MFEWTVYWFMFPGCIAIAAAAMLTGISGTAMLTPTILLVFPFLKVPLLTPGQAVGMALFTEFFGFVSGVIGYRRRGLIDFATVNSSSRSPYRPSPSFRWSSCSPTACSYAVSTEGC